jgi:tetratricopeptide (TPR) repeat protein
LLETSLARRATFAGADRSPGKQVFELEKAKDWKGLTQRAQEQLIRDPDSADWELIAGYGLLQQRSYAQAVAAFSRATRRSPEDVDGWNLLGESFRLSGDPQAAIRTLEHAITVGRTSSAAFFLLGEAYRDYGRPDRAIQAYRESVRIDPGFSATWFGLGLAYLQTGQRDQLGAVLEPLRRLSPPLAGELEKARDTPGRAR